MRRTLGTGGSRLGQRRRRQARAVGACRHLVQHADDAIHGVGAYGPSLQGAPSQSQQVCDGALYCHGLHDPRRLQDLVGHVLPALHRGNHHRYHGCARHTRRRGLPGIAFPREFDRLLWESHGFALSSRGHFHKGRWRNGSRFSRGLRRCEALPSWRALPGADDLQRRPEVGVCPRRPCARSEGLHHGDAAGNEHETPPRGQSYPQGVVRPAERCRRIVPPVRHHAARHF
mmetsp:Transcript_35659/g.70937  ORF Transcript_35659/g.70937 Transcript_35659/m.70937 type:complete len:230 (+) Transcript_35659:443-1132(+)